MPPQSDPTVPTGSDPAPPARQESQLSYNSIRARAAFGYYDGILDLVFRFGFSTVFLANAWTAVVDPGGFLKLIEGNFLAHMVGHYELQVHLITLNDLMLGMLILSGLKRKLVYAWAGAWLIIVTFFKITSLV